MYPKPTYEELEQRIAELEKQVEACHLQEGSAVKEVQESLRVSEEQYRILFEHTGEALFVAQAGKLVLSNPRNSVITGYSCDELRSRQFVDFIHEHDRKLVQDRHFARLKGKRPPRRYSFRIIHKSGAIRWVELNAALITWGGRPATLCFMTDVTERKQAEEQRQRLETQLSNALAIARLGYWEYDVGSDLFTFNDQFYNMYRTTIERVGRYEMSSAEYAQRFVHPEDGYMVREEIRLCLETDDPTFRRRLEHRIVFPDGETGYISVHFFIVKDDFGKTVRTYGINQDITERVRSESILRENQAKYQTILNSSMDGFCIVDASGRIQEVNDAYCRMSGYSAEELLSMRISDLEACEDAAAAQSHMRKIAQAGSDRFESRHRRKDGVIFDVEVSVQYHPVEEGQFISFLRDITDRKQAFESIKHANEKMRLAADAAHFGIWSLDLHENLLEWDDWMLRLHGISREDFAGTLPSWLAYVHPNDRERTGEELQLALLGEKAFDTAFKIIRPDKKIRTIKAYATVSHDKHGAPSSMTGISYDMTDQVKATTALKESEERFRALHNASFGGIAIHDKGRILACNQGLSDITGFPYEELIGMDGLSLISDDTRDLVLRNIEAGYEKPYEATGVRKDGSLYPLRLEARNIPYQGKQVRVVEFRDISENKAAENQRTELEVKLRQAVKMEAIGRLAGGVAHDFNNMLGVIIGYSEMALDLIEQDSSLSMALSGIHQAALRSADLTRQLLAFARKQTIEPKIINLNKTIENMLAMLRRLIGEDIELAWRPSKQIGPVYLDPSQVDQILANLCINARDAITDNGSITIETMETDIEINRIENFEEISPGPYVLFSVSDNGCGMNNETMERLFEPFFTTKQTGKGTGLGLATVFGIVKQNKGFITVQSAPGHGATFVIGFPRHEIKADSIISDGLQHVIVGGSETILLVEDEATIRQMTSDMLERMGYRVISAATPGEAIDLFRSQDRAIQLLITDVIMPEMNGRDLATRLQVMHPGIKCLFISGYPADIISSHGILDTGQHFLQKPFSRADMSKKIRTILDEPPTRLH